MSDRPDDLELVRLVLARQRRQGVQFELAWEAALAALRPGTARRAGKDHAGVLNALAETREDWRRAFEGLPPREPPGRAAAAYIASVIARQRRAVAA